MSKWKPNHLKQNMLNFGTYFPCRRISQQFDNRWQESRNFQNWQFSKIKNRLKVQYLKQRLKKYSTSIKYENQKIVFIKDIVIRKTMKQMTAEDCKEILLLPPIASHSFHMLDELLLVEKRNSKNLMRLAHPWKKT